VVSGKTGTSPDATGSDRCDSKRARRQARKRNRDIRTRKRGGLIGEAGDGWFGPLPPERIMPRDELERRRGLESRMVDEVSAPIDGAASDPVAGLRGRIVEVSTALCRVSVDGRMLVCAVRGSLSAFETGDTNVVAVGDWVAVREAGDGQGVVEEVLPRRSEIVRPDPMRRHLRHVVAANVDQMLVIAAWKAPRFWPELVDRYLIAAERSHVTPVLCVNKVDLASSPAEMDAVLNAYRDLGYRVLLTSALRGDGVVAVRDLLAGQVTVLVGLSGVGKSALLSAMHPGLDLRIGAVNERRGQGRHTTTQATMVAVGDGGWVVDTAGIREFGLVGLRQDDLAAHYPEIAAAAPRCRFADCRHEREPGCAVLVAVAAGTVTAMRLDSFLKIRATLPT
jgi:ribosome biogenesis GTPase / thiamine phosphate phosphatase